MYYLQSRYYNPQTGRFLNADALVSTGQGILGNNMFAYCGNNPVTRKDSTGTAFEFTAEYTADVDPDGEHDDKGGRVGGHKAKGGSGARGGFRSGLQKLTGQSGDGYDAHHVFPVKFIELFYSIGIDIRNPAYGAWWEHTAHLQSSYAYNDWWGVFWSIPGVTAGDAFAVAEFLSNLYGFEINF